MVVFSRDSTRAVLHTSVPSRTMPPRRKSAATKPPSVARQPRKRKAKERDPPVEEPEEEPAKKQRKTNVECVLSTLCLLTNVSF
jgi:hypothetical protein